jgi:hypothetical protein
MQISMYQASVPLFLQILGSLSAILDKAEAYCASKKITPEVMTATRLIPDMFPLARQIQIATDQAKGCVARLAGIEVPPYPDTETTFAELKARIAKTVDFVKSVPAGKIDGSEERAITLKVGGQDLSFTGIDYLRHFVLPNFYFHATTTYNILREAGVEIGKRDFLGR